MDHFLDDFFPFDSANDAARDDEENKNTEDDRPLFRVSLVLTFSRFRGRSTIPSPASWLP